MGKLPPCRSGDPGGHPESKWSYFKSLMFLVGIVKPRTTSSNLKISKTQAQDNEKFEIEAHTADRGTEPTEGVQEVETESAEAQLVETGDLSRKRKRNEINSKYNQQMILIEKKKASLLERVIQERRCDDTDDALFFRSLLPYVSKIPEHLKLRFRNKVQQVVDEFVYSGTQDITYTPSPSYSCGGTSSNSNQDILYTPSPGYSYGGTSSNSNEHTVETALHEDLLEL